MFCGEQQSQIADMKNTSMTASSNYMPITIVNLCIFIYPWHFKNKS